MRAVSPLTLLILITGISSVSALERQTITFGPLSEKKYGSPPFPVIATTSSRLQVRFQALTTDVCTMNGNAVTVIGVGPCTIRASQDGSAEYSPAPDVQQTFIVKKADQAITFPSLNNKTVTDSTFTISAIA